MTGDYFEAEDLAQETFVAAYKNYESFDGNNIKAWLTKIAANKCKDYLKNASRRMAPTSDEYLETFSDNKYLPEERTVQNDIQNRLLHICSLLKEPYKTVAINHFYYGLSILEISKTTGKNIKTLQTQIYRAKAFVKKLWKEEFS